MKNQKIQRSAFETMVRACAQKNSKFTLAGILESWYPVLFEEPYNIAEMRPTKGLALCRKKFRELLKEKGTVVKPKKKKKLLKKKALKKKDVLNMEKEKFVALAKEKKYTDYEIALKLNSNVAELKKYRKEIKGNLPLVLELDGEREIFEA